MSLPPQSSPISGLSTAAAFEQLGKLIDKAQDTANLALADLALALADELEARSLTPEEFALLDYFRANAWATRYEARLGDRAAIWDFEQEEIRQQVYLLRRAAFSPGFDNLDQIRRCQILTNLGNQLDTVGRFIDAHATWSAALEVNPQFWMAQGNRGAGRVHYARALYDEGHRRLFAFAAHQDLTQALEHAKVHRHPGPPDALTYFSDQAEQIAAALDLDAFAKVYQPDAWSLGDSAQEQEYRRWCLQRTLFLNPLNDLGPLPIAARDVMTLPSFQTKASQGPVEVGMFNELKQGYATARLLLWEGLHQRGAHYSDRDVLLYDTFDLSTHSMSTEKVKLAFRVAYSSFDKIAFFLNHYLELGIPERGVSFRRLWREKVNGPVRARIANSENWPLRGLFWLSKDLYDPVMSDSMEPQARAAAELRNHLEHKYLKVVEGDVPAPQGVHDSLAHIITREALENRTLRLLQLARSALMYLSLAMHHEERKRPKVGPGLVLPITLVPVPDPFKR